jgi:hypothetical protein
MQLPYKTVENTLLNILLEKAQEDTQLSIGRLEALKDDPETYQLELESYEEYSKKEDIILSLIEGTNNSSSSNQTQIEIYTLDNNGNKIPRHEIYLAQRTK